MGQTGNFCVLVGDTLLGIHQNQAHVGPLDSADGPQVAVPLNGVVHLGFPAHTGGVNKQILAVLIFKIAVDGVAGRAGHIGHNHTLFAQDAIEQTGLTHVGLADDGHLDDVLVLFLLHFLGEGSHTGVQQITGAVAMDGGYLDGITQAQGVELVDIGVDLSHAVAFVDGQNHRLFGALQHGAHGTVGGGEAHGHIGDHNDDIRRLNGDLRLTAHKLQHLAVGARLDAAGIHQRKGPAVPLAVAVKTVPGDAGRVLHDGCPAAGQFIE